VGIALALGPNITSTSIPSVARRVAAVERAQSLARRAPQHERTTFEALSRRYFATSDRDLKALAVEYSVAMGELRQALPDDLDAATLYAEKPHGPPPLRL